MKNRPRWPDEWTLPMKLPMKRAGMLLPALAASVACQAVEPVFYMVDIRHDGDAMLHTTEAKTSAVKRPLTVLGNAASDCCFVPGAQSKGTRLKVDNDDPRLSSSRGDETFAYLGAYRPAHADAARDRLGFGFKDMRTARLIGKRTYEVTFTDATKPVVVRHCLGTEGVNVMLYHSAQDAKPYVSYYYALGYDVESDCPDDLKL
jgi:hypothetical protein